MGAAPKTFFAIEFSGINELLELAKKQAQLLKENVEAGVANTTLLGVARIANDCPVDTGRARASLAGELASESGVDLAGDPRLIADGIRNSVTKYSGLEGVIGSNVDYILYLEYGHKATGPKNLTRKQLRYLFASGILKSTKLSSGKSVVRPGTVTVLKWGKFRNTKKGRNGQIVDNRSQIGANKSINRRSGAGTWVKGKGMFRKNIPVLQNHFNQQMELAIKATTEGRSLRKGS
ncbi:MAG: hypothetical protein WA118_08300 [Carboxydocellales bacterium]